MAPYSLRGGGVFTEGRWRKQSSAEVLALKTHIKKTSECRVLWRGSEIC